VLTKTATWFTPSQGYSTTGSPWNAPPFVAPPPQPDQFPPAPQPDQSAPVAADSTAAEPDADAALPDPEADAFNPARIVTDIVLAALKSIRAPDEDNASHPYAEAARFITTVFRDNLIQSGRQHINAIIHHHGPAILDRLIDDRRRSAQYARL
jgi:hypothetical protein